MVLLTGGQNISVSFSRCLYLSLNTQMAFLHGTPCWCFGDNSCGYSVIPLRRARLNKAGDYREHAHPKHLLSYLRYSEVTKNQPAISQQKNVLRLEVPVENMSVVHVVQAERDLHEPVKDFALRKKPPP